MEDADIKRRSSSIRMAKEREEKRKQRRATALVTSGALTFIILAATLVTASFLMSPVIEKIFGKRQSKEHEVYSILITNLKSVADFVQL